MLGMPRSLMAGIAVGSIDCREESYSILLRKILYDRFVKLGEYN